MKLKITLVLILAGFCVSIRASNLDTIGVTLLRETTTNLNGAEIRVTQPEAELTNNPPTWEVNPAAAGQPVNLFTYISSAGSSTAYTNSLGVNSGHADSVAQNFYGIPNGVATNVAHVDNYEADDFYSDVISATIPQNINDSVVNQSFIFGSVPDQVSVSEQQQIDSDYDNYAAKFGTLFISGAGNSGSVCPPATCYNGIGVAAYGGSSSHGPTVDNGRAKPDITAPAGATSFSTPLVAGAAAILIQAANRGDGGSDTNSAADIRMIKALLLNGAVKPTNWTHSASSPLDIHYGAGVLNIFNSYEQLVGGKYDFISSEMISSGGAHPPDGNPGTMGASSGWDFNSVSSSSGGILSSAQDGVNHYYFNVTNNLNDAPFTATMTLVWDRQQNQTAINNLNLFLYNCANSNLVACSTSVVDNVEEIFLPRLAPGRYDLQVLKSAANSVSDNETYALAWEFFSQSLSEAKSGTNLFLSWPVYPAGFVLESATNLISPDWQTNDFSPALTNDQNVVLVNATNAAQFFRLRAPNF